MQTITALHSVKKYDFNDLFTLVASYAKLRINYVKCL